MSVGVAAMTGGIRLLERQKATHGLRNALGDARAGIGRLVLVAGEAGVGKSALVRHFCDEASASVQVLWGGCDPLFTPRPLGPFLDIAEEAGGELQAAVEEGPLEVVAALLQFAPPRSAAIVVVEDVHWADEATLDVLRLLGRKLGQVPLLVVATYRNDELDRVHPLRVVLGELATYPHVQRAPISPLSPEAVADLAAQAEVDAAELHRLTGGNPFFVTEVLASGNEAIPPTVRDAVLARAARLTAEARALLDAVAIAPPRVELWLLETLASEQVSALEECLTSGMLVERAGAVEFRHELARLAIEESLEPRRRLSLHREALVALASPRVGVPDVARLAYHAGAAEDVDAVLRFAPAAAARAASLGAHREAAVHFGRTLRFGDRLSDDERAALLEQRSRECYLTDDIDDAIDAAVEALELRRTSGQRLREGGLLCWLSEILWCPGRTEESARAAAEAVALLETLPPSRELAYAYVRNGWELADKALALAEELGDTELALRIRGTIGARDFMNGGSAMLEESIERARAANMVELTGNLSTFLVSSALGARRYDLAARYIDAGLGYCSDRGLELYRFYLLGYRAQMELDLGRWDEAAETAAAVLRIRRASIMPRIVGLTVLGLVRARRGDPGSRDPLDEAWSLAEPTRELFRMGPTAAARAEVAWLAGDRDGVAAATDDALQLALAQGNRRALGQMAVWRRRAGIDDALPSSVDEPYALQLAGEWALAAERWRELGCPYEVALALAEANEEEPLRRALEELQRLEARPAAAIVSRRLRELGVRGVARGPRPSTRRNDAELTARELEVLRLLAEGLRNAAIAERLFLSPRTVENHVSAILRKLNAQSRGEAVAEAARLTLLQDR